MKFIELTLLDQGRNKILISAAKIVSISRLKINGMDGTQIDVGSDVIRVTESYSEVCKILEEGC